ncbi:multidrug resistance-associated protein 4-like isoform X5 [Mizuhopecten yessoensis]|uniref:multidrug resistance-associated protein 4-like isoform X5 n=1 Tax=Mizuhopecten yessoensis TaxID=6573 RepID=UPI000B45EAB3|nr:multidrug resistance-associated protein 4-like isoform X5 [Mizuhopecten yessoensis]
MDETIRHHNPNPLLTANPISKVFFWWLNPTFSTGYKRRLEVDDLFNVVKCDSSEELGNRLEKEWEKELKKQESGGKASLLKALVRMFGFQYMLLGIIVFIEEGTKVVQPLLLGQLIRYFTPDSTVSERDAYLYAMGVSLCAIVLAVAHHPYFFGVQRIGMQMRVACCSLLYRKSLRLSNTALGQTTTGQIVNLMSNDVNRFDTAVLFLHFLLIGPCQVIAVLVILWLLMGPSSIAGIGLLLIIIPSQSIMGKLFTKLRHKTAIHTDERVKVMNEIITGMRVIKMYCWEKPFGELVSKLRNLEMRRVRSTQNTRSLIVGPFFTSSKLLVFLTFLPFTLTGHPLVSDVTFVTIAMYQAIHVSTVLFIPQGVQFATECRVTVIRLQKFLLLDELKVERPITGIRPQIRDCMVKIDNITANWDEKIEQPTLKNISVEVGHGKLLAVIGPVGAGKSSLLMSVLKEIPLSEGKVTVKGRIAYVSQQAWVFSASLRQNIVFGGVFDNKKYNRVLKACALHKDMDMMPQGDSTLIGDRGVSLSGGQRARVSLARALYMDADVYLLDDPLSAVDAAVSRHLFENVIQGVLKSKPVILVTHQLQFLAEADELIILKDGECVGQGTFEEMASSGVDFSSLLKTEKDDEEDNEEEQHILQRLDSHISSRSPGPSDIGSTFSLTSIGTEFQPEPVQLPEEEERKGGTIGWKVYFEYFKAGSGVFSFTILVLLNLLAQVSYVMSDWWLSIWSNQEEHRHYMIQQDQALRDLGHNITNITIPYVDTHQNIYIFTGIIVAVFLFGILRALMFFKVAVDASMNLHNGMFNRLLRVPIAFFDTNPVGRILNRFSKDTGHMDDMLPITFFDFVQCFLLILGIILVVCVVNPWVFIPLVPLCIVFYVTRTYHIKTSRHIKRLEGTTRSPVFSHLSASLQGLHSIRAFSIQDKFMEEFDNHQDLHSEAWFMFLSTSRWLAVRLDWICAMFVTVVALLSVLMSKDMDAGKVGLSLTYAMTLMGMFQWAVRQSAEVENQMISVERVLDYSRLETEGDLESKKGHKPPPEWPPNGEIKGTNVTLKYSKTGPLVLKHLSFYIKGREKVGIVGRTGAGKSSLIAMMFRLTEHGGNVLLDGVNIQEIGLHDLRKQISIIPQDPVLFTGPLRKNLDPFCNHDDNHLWNALEEVQMKVAVEDLPGGLEAEVSEGGINFSVGQRQLICLARAILRKNRVLMIDEATANVDPRTDELIQKTIRDKFRQCTVLTIAHRLNTIMDSDRVLVLDEGNIVEFDQPYLLLQNEEGNFYRMVQQTGKTEADHLLEVARDCYHAEISSIIPGLASVHDDERKSKEDKLGSNLQLDDSVFDTSKISFADDSDEEKKEEVQLNHIDASVEENAEDDTVVEEESGICSPSALESEAMFESQPLLVVSDAEEHSQAVQLAENKIKDEDDDNEEEESSHLLPKGANGSVEENNINTHL